MPGHCGHAGKTGGLKEFGGNSSSGPEPIREQYHALNYLVHLFLSDPAPQCLLGTLMGDFVKGPIPQPCPPAVRWGIELHRKVDLFAHHNPDFRRSRLRIDDSFGYFRGVMVDVFYDHFMARSWNRYSETPLPEFARGIYDLLARHLSDLPRGLQDVAPRMISHDWLNSYRKLEIIGRVLARLSDRLGRPNPLGRGLAELENNYSEMEADFNRFLASASEHVEELRRARR
jgi:acyl carrier protein phosphodiesterase